MTQKNCLGIDFAKKFEDTEENCWQLNTDEKAYWEKNARNWRVPGSNIIITAAVWSGCDNYKNLQDDDFWSHQVSHDVVTVV